VSNALLAGQSRMLTAGVGRVFLPAQSVRGNWRRRAKALTLCTSAGARIARITSTLAVNLTGKRGKISGDATIVKVHRISLSRDLNTRNMIGRAPKDIMLRLRNRGRFYADKDGGW
jgi:hypothetical protein